MRLSLCLRRRLSRSRIATSIGGAGVFIAIVMGAILVVEGFTSLAKPARDVVILTRGRWAEAHAHTVSAGWQVLESRTVGGKDVVVIGGPLGGDGRSTPR